MLDKPQGRKPRDSPRPVGVLRGYGDCAERAGVDGVMSIALRAVERSATTPEIGRLDSNSGNGPPFVRPRRSLENW